MGRPRAADYDAKRDMILEKAAQLFARDGYDGTSLSDLASACGVSKALLYHYCANKEELLDDIIGQHLSDLLDVVRAADDRAAAPENRLRRLAGALLEAYRDADSKHKIQINDLARLPHDKQERLKNMERELVAIFSDAIIALNPAIATQRELLRPMTMSLFGMLNWHYLWFKPGKGLSREDYANMAASLIADGVRKLKIEAAPPATATARPDGSRRPKRA